MTSLPSPVSTPTEDAYNALTAALHTSEEGATLEIAILPSSSYAAEILHDHEPPSLALPSTLLTPLYLHARSILFAHLTSPNPAKSSEEYGAALTASSVVLLWDPNHLTAANFRKRHILLLYTQYIDDNYREEDVRKLRDGVRNELRFLDSLLTSPLHKHTKSSTLWAHRYWLLRYVFDFCLPHLKREDSSARQNNPTSEDVAVRTRKLWGYEMSIIMKAGERHPRNYYAWGYARQLFSLVDGKMNQWGEMGRVEWLGMGMGRMHAWCLMHPRDVSGWGFLVFLMQRVVREGSWGGSEVRRVVWETREWVRKYEWRGESVEWFLKAVGQLQLG